MKRFECDGQSITIEHDQKILFPAIEVTKGELADYYQRIAPVMVPHIANRQLTMQRYPEGVEKEGFYQKDIPNYFPSWIKRACSSKKTGDTICYVVADSAAALVYMVSQDAVVYHVSLSNIDKPNYPDHLIFDLDPSDGDWSKVCFAAHAVRDLLETELGLTTFVMTTGSRGLHIVVPLNRRFDFEKTKSFSRSVAELLAQRHPDMLTADIRKDKRADRVFIDYLRNAYGQTGVAPYSVRARSNAPIATPLEWHEVTETLRSDAFTIKNIFKRLGHRNDPWKEIDKHAQSLSKALNKFKKLIS
jgi:bifunctional non-homologous end joining protein LigD